MKILAKVETIKWHRTNWTQFPFNRFEFIIECAINEHNAIANKRFSSLSVIALR